MNARPLAIVGLVAALWAACWSADAPSPAALSADELARADGIAVWKWSLGGADAPAYEARVWVILRRPEQRPTAIRLLACRGAVGGAPLIVRLPSDGHRGCYASCLGTSSSSDLLDRIVGEHAAQTALVTTMPFDGRAHRIVTYAWDLGGRSEALDLVVRLLPIDARATGEPVAWQPAAQDIDEVR